MRFKEFISEETNRLNYFDYKEDEIIKTLKEECSEIIGIYKSVGKYLYRGEKDSRIDRIFKASIHKERVPVQMDMKTHNRFNRILQENGFAAHRGNSIFTTGDKFNASDWGSTFIVLPTNGFDYTWFDYDDSHSYGYVYNDIDDFAKSRRHQISYTRMKEYGLEGIKKHLDLNPEKEEKDTLEKYQKYGFNPDGSIKPWDEINDELWKEFVLNNLGAMKTRLKEAVNNGKEVLFANCEYYGLPLDSRIYKSLFKN